VQKPDPKELVVEKQMGWLILKHIFTTLFTFINIRRLSDQEKRPGDTYSSSTTVHHAAQT